MQIICMFSTNPSWRHWLARSTVNRKIGGSSPPEGEHFFIYFSHLSSKASDIISRGKGKIEMIKRNTMK